MRFSLVLILVLGSAPAMAHAPTLAQSSSLWSQLLGSAEDQVDYPAAIGLSLGGKSLPFSLDGTGALDGSSLLVGGLSLGFGIDQGAHGFGIGGGLGEWGPGGELTHAQLYYRYRFLRRSRFCFDLPFAVGILARGGGQRTQMGSGGTEPLVFPYATGAYGQFGLGTELLPGSMIGLRVVTLMHYTSMQPVRQGHYVTALNDEGQEVRQVETFGIWPGASAVSIGVSVGLELRLKIENTGG